MALAALRHRPGRPARGDRRARAGPGRCRTRPSGRPGLRTPACWRRSPGTRSATRPPPDAPSTRARPGRARRYAVGVPAPSRAGPAMRRHARRQPSPMARSRPSFSIPPPEICSIAMPRIAVTRPPWWPGSEPPPAGSRPGVPGGSSPASRLLPPSRSAEPERDPGAAVYADQLVHAGDRPRAVPVSAHGPDAHTPPVRQARRARSHRGGRARPRPRPARSIRPHDLRFPVACLGQPSTRRGQPGARRTVRQMTARRRRPAAAARAACARRLGSPGPAELSAMTSGLPLTLRRPWQQGPLDQGARVRQHGRQEAVRPRRRTG